MNSNLKRYERGYEKGIDTDGILRLANHDVDIKNSEIILSVDEFDEEKFNELFSVKTGTWEVKDGYIEGTNPKMCPGMIVSKDDYFGDIMLEIKCKMISPSTHDINIMINGEWYEDTNSRGLAYVAGMEAFWHGNIGFEKSPEYKLTVATQLFEFDPQKEHTFCLGNAGGHLFVLSDGKKCLEITDPDPIDREKYGKIGFEAFASKWKFKSLKVYRLKHERIKEYYNPEF